jgi:hypothetical protein
LPIWYRYTASTPKKMRATMPERMVKKINIA